MIKIKHNLKITFIILGMFLLTQFIGLYVVNFYSTVNFVDGEITNVTAPALPYGMGTPKIEQEKDFYTTLPSIIMSFFFAFAVLFLLMKFKVAFFLRAWFFVVVAISLGISINSFLRGIYLSSLIALMFGITLAFLKIYRRDILIHNITELLIYPGIAAVFVPILNIWTIIILLVLISVYDLWAVWHSGIMQKMASYQINNLKVFSGFFIPYISKKLKAKLDKLKKSELKDKKIKVNVAMLGGGDVVFPIITSGVVMRYFGLLPAILVILGATAGISYLMFFAEKKKFYPAMPFITIGILIGILVSWAFFV